MNKLTVIVLVWIVGSFVLGVAFGRFAGLNDARARKIREMADERDISLAAAADIYDGMAEDAEDAAREIRGGTRSENHYHDLGVNPNYDGLD